MTTQREFKVGDRVKAWGLNGVVVNADIVDSEFAVQVQFECTDIDVPRSFTPDGRYYYWHKTPTLKHRKFKPKSKAPRGKVGGDVIWASDIDHRYYSSRTNRCTKFIEAEDQS